MDAITPISKESWLLQGEQESKTYWIMGREDRKIKNEDW